MEKINKIKEITVLKVKNIQKMSASSAKNERHAEGSIFIDNKRLSEINYLILIFN